MAVIIMVLFAINRAEFDVADVMDNLATIIFNVDEKPAMSTTPIL